MKEKIEHVFRDWLREHASDHPYDTDALEADMRTALGTWQADLITRLMREYRQHRLHRQDVENVIGERKYIFQVYYEKSQINDHYLVTGWAYNPIYGKPMIANVRLLGKLTEAEMRIAWSHFKAQVKAATPERAVPFGHAGETWNFHAAWNRSLNAVRFFNRTTK